MVDVLTWSADADWHGFTPSNERAVLAAFDIITEAVGASMAKRLVRVQSH